MIDPITTQRILDVAQIYDIVSDFISLKKRGVNYVGLCPFHNDKSPSFYVSPTKNICKCFSCGEGGTPVHFIMKHENLTYPDALKFLARKYNIEVVERELSDEEKLLQSKKESMYILNDFACNTFSDQLLNSEEGKVIGLSYFRERGFTDETIRKFRLGYAFDSRSAFSEKALKAGYKKEVLVATGLSIGRDDGSLIDRFYNRVIFPVHSLSGNIIAFGGRILQKKDKTAKYINSPESDVYSKGNELFGLYFAKNEISKQNKCYLVEGYTDVISMHQAGMTNVVASSGTALTRNQIRKIRRFTSNVTLIYDGDEAGIKAALRGIDLLLEEGLKIKVVLLPEGEDPDSYARNQGASLFSSYIDKNETDFIHFKIKLLLNDAKDDPIQKSAMINSVIQTISVIPDDITRSVYIKDAALILDIKEATINREVNSKRLKKIDEEYKKQSYSNARDKEGDIESKSLPQENNRSNDVVISEKNQLYKYEYELIRYVVCYGMHRIFNKYQFVKRKETIDFRTTIVEEKVLIEEGPFVIEFIVAELIEHEDHQIMISHPILKEIFIEAMNNARQNTEFIPYKYFSSHPNVDISRMAFKMIESREKLSKIHSKILGEDPDFEESKLKEENQLNRLVPRAVFDLKNALLMSRLNEISAEIKHLSPIEEDKIRQLLMEKIRLEALKKHMAKELGDRIFQFI